MHIQFHWRYKAADGSIQHSPRLTGLSPDERESAVPVHLDGRPISLTEEEIDFVVYMANEITKVFLRMVS